MSPFVLIGNAATVPPVSLAVAGGTLGSLIGGTKRIAEPSTLIECESDAEIIAAAEAMLDALKTARTEGCTLQKRKPRFPGLKSQKSLGAY